jgi:hypothetical protein
MRNFYGWQKEKTFYVSVIAKDAVVDGKRPAAEFNSQQEAEADIKKRRGKLIWEFLEPIPDDSPAEAQPEEIKLQEEVKSQETKDEPKLPEEVEPVIESIDQQIEEIDGKPVIINIHITLRVVAKDGA